MLFNFKCLNTIQSAKMLVFFYGLEKIKSTLHLPPDHHLHLGVNFVQQLIANFCKVIMLRGNF